MSLVLVERSPDGSIATATLNRPDVLNALNYALLGELKDAFEAFAADEDLGCVIVTGAGRAFCAGVDLGELGTPEPGDVKRKAIEAVRECPVPIIAAVNGAAVTGGFELALACDVIIASNQARFADTHARVGVLPRWGLTQHLPRLVGHGRARELSFSGRFIDAEAAERWGLANHVTAPEELMPAALELAAEIAANDRRAVRAIKALYRDADVGLGPGLDVEAAAGNAFNRGVPQTEVARRRETLRSRNRNEA